MSTSNHQDETEPARYIAHRHAPPHLFCPDTLYFITAKTLDGAPTMQLEARRIEIIDALRFAATKHAWELLAWVALNNHYHCILRSPSDSGEALSKLIEAAHKFTSRRWNAEDDTAGRQVWYQYWDTCLTHESSFLARINYIHFNPVKHELVSHPAEYPFSSYEIWRERDSDWLDHLEAAYPCDRLDLE